MANAIVDGFCELESSLQLKTWFSSVPTHSNLGDGQRRLDFSLANSLGCARCQNTVARGQRVHLDTPESKWGYGGA